ncbi:MAG: tetratricopeptide repeat protein [Pseudomonadota bacterium]
MKNIHVFFGISLVFIVNQTYASVKIAIPEAQWQFTLQHISLDTTDAAKQIKPDEQPLVIQLKPLLKAQKYQQAHNTLRTQLPASPSIALLLLQGQVAMQLNEYAIARQAYTKAIEQSPELIDAHRALALIALRQQNTDSAKKHIQKAIQLGAQDAQLFGQLAYIHVKTDSPWSAVSGYRQALLLQPHNEQWERGLLHALVASGSINEAQTLIKQILNTTNDDSDLWLYHAQLSLQNDNPKQALRSMEIALRNGEKAAANLVLAAQLHMQHGSGQRAVDLFRKAIEKDKRFINEVLQGISFFLQENASVKIQPLMKTLETQSAKLDTHSRSRFYLYRAFMAQHKNKHEEAQKYLLKAVSEDNNNGQALFETARHFDERNQKERAAAYYVRATVIPNVAEQALIAHAQMEINHKNYTKALQLLRDAYDKNPQRHDLLQNIRQLEQIALSQ